MEDLVRPAQSPGKSQGYKPPPANAINQASPVLDIAGDASAVPETDLHAYLDRVTDHAFWPHLRMLLAGAQEIVSAWRNVTTSFTINPNVCSVWRLKCYSETLSLTFDALEALPEDIAATLWASSIRVATIEIIVDWQAAVSGSRTLTLSGVKFADGEVPIWTPTTGEDTILVQITSDGEKRGFAAGLDMQVP